MLLKGTDERLLGIPQQFDSPFPSNDSMLSGYYTAMLDTVLPGEPDTIGAGLIVRAQANAWRNALAIGNKMRATTVGVLTEWLPRISWKGPSSSGWQGLFAPPSFPATTTESRLFDAVVNVGLDKALDIVGAAPIVGGVMKFILGLGQFFAGLAALKEPDEEKKLLLPWAKYSDRMDEDVVRAITDSFYSNNDWTRMFLPQFERGIPWSLAVGVDDGGRELGEIWSPNKNGAIAYSGGLGGMPGTFRVAGDLQAPYQRYEKSLARFFTNGVEMRVGRVVVDKASFLPATAQTLALAWQQAQAAGAPEMYTIDTYALEEAWVDYWDNFFDSLEGVYKHGGTWADQWIYEFAYPYIAVRGKNWRLGLEGPKVPPLHRAHPAPLITPGIFKTGLADPATRNQCLYVELPKTGEQLAFPPPYIEKDGRVVASGGVAWDPDRAMKDLKGKCVQWPSPDEYFNEFARPDAAILVPAIRRLRERQISCLSKTLACAYVRPDKVGDKPAFGAFTTGPHGQALAKLCHDMRGLLLQNDARFAVILADVDEVDPAFAQQLRASGVTNSFAQLQAAKFHLSGQAGLDKNEDPIPEPLPPQGGVPFDTGDLAAPGGGEGSGGGLVVAGVVATVLAALALR